MTQQEGGPPNSKWREVRMGANGSSYPHSCSPRIGGNAQAQQTFIGKHFVCGLIGLHSLIDESASQSVSGKIYLLGGLFSGKTWFLHYHLNCIKGSIRIVLLRLLLHCAHATDPMWDLHGETLDCINLFSWQLMLQEVDVFLHKALELTYAADQNTFKNNAPTFPLCYER